MTWLPAQPVTVPALLAALAVVDGALAGFRAARGRNARIRRRSYTLTAARRGAAVALVGLAVTTAVSLAGLGRHRSPDLLAAGGRMLAVLVPYAGLAVLSLAAYRLLPIREGTLVIVIWLGPFTLARPVVVAAAAAAACAGSGDGAVWATAATAAIGVLTVEPLVHRRWYREPL
jgi:hypothetical protein